MNLVYLLLLLLMTLLGSIASLFLKKASSRIKIKEIFKNYNLFIGAFLYLLSSILNILLLKKIDYSIVLPLTSLTYVWTLLIANKFLKEKITKKKILGITLILIGAFLII